MKSKSQHLGILLISIGCVLLIACLVLISHNSQEDLEAQEAVMQNLPQLQRIIEERKKIADEQKKNEIPEAFEIYYEDETEDEEEETPRMTVTEIDGYNYIGYLSFPTLGTELPVLDECTLNLLRKAPCRYSGSYYTDNLVIAAHNYKSSFGKLKKLEIGDEVYFTDMDGTVHVYEVGDIEVLEPESVVEMVYSSWPLSLYTCTYDGSERLTVRCGYIEQDD